MDNNQIKSNDQKEENKIYKYIKIISIAGAVFASTFLTTKLLSSNNSLELTNISGDVITNNINSNEYKLLDSLISILKK